MNRREAIAAIGASALLPAAVADTDPAGLKGDIRILREALQLHPGLYRYSSPAAIEERLLRLELDFAAAPTTERRYLLLSLFMASLRCGHSYCNFLNQKKPVAASLFDRPTRLPFQFAWIGRRMVVTGDPAGLGLARGTEILSVNGAAASAMLDALMPYARADGHNDGKRVALLGVAGAESIETFDVFQGLVFGAPGGVHRLVLRPPGGPKRTVELPAIGLAQRRAQRRLRDPASNGPVWDWSMPADGVAVLTMPTWALYNSKWDWRTWLDDRLSSLSGAKGLIVDLRGNEGGQDCGDRLLARLPDPPVGRPTFERRVRFRRTPAHLDPYLDTWDDSFRTLGAAARPIGGGFLRLDDVPAEEIGPPGGPRLAVPVAVLIGPANSSATFQFAQNARRSRLVRLFGQTTGGNRRGINGGAFFFVRLPASGLEFDLPLIGFYPPGTPPDAGLAPDVAVAPTLRDVASGRDPAMAAARDWILG